MTDQTLKDIDRAFKALEERDELLNNIRAEIEGELKQNNHSFYRAALEDVLKIIEKHRK